MDSIELGNEDHERTFVVAPEFFDAINDLRQQINVLTEEEVLQYALTLLYVVSKERYTSGAKLYLSYPKGGFREVRFWNSTKPMLVAVDGDIIKDNE